jgi:uridine kinase
VGVVGASGSGKTTVAQALTTLHPQACFLSQDNYYQTPPAGTDCDAWNFDDPRAVDLDRLARDLAALKRGEAVEQPQYDFPTHSRAEKTETIFPAPLVIVEGLFLFCTPALRDVFDLKVFIDAPLEICLARRIARDCAERGRNEAMIRRRWQEQVAPMFLEHVAPAVRFADRVMPSLQQGSPEYNALLLDVSCDVERLLSC